MSNPTNLEEEFELTFLAKSIPKEIKGVEPQKMRDTYLPQDSEHPHVRLRQKNDHYEITKKQPVNQSDISHQTEQTIPLDQEEYETLDQVSKRSVTKDRYVVNLNGHTAEIDVFTDGLKGLVVIDFEFENHEEKTAFMPPECCLAEITQENFIAGGMLAGKSYSDIEADLKRYGYKPLSLCEF